MKQYKGDLGASCLQFLLSLPKEIVELELDRMISALKVRYSQSCFVPEGL